MKIIDEKGKLFGRVNIIDLLVLLIIIAVIAGVGWLLFGRQVTQALSEEMEITYTVKCRGLQPEVYDSIINNTPSQLMAAGELVNGEVKDAVKSVHVTQAYTDDGRIVAAEDESRIDIVFTVTAVVPKNSVKMEIGTQEVRVGKDHIVKTVYFEVTGIITSVDIPS